MKLKISKYRRFPLLAVMLAFSSSLYAEQIYDFSYGELYYKITSETTVSLSPKEVIYENGETKYIVSEATTVQFGTVCDESTNTWYEVTGIADHAFENGNVEEIDMGYGADYNLTSIGKAAFKNCTNLKSISLPGTLTSIGEDAFNSCTALSLVGLINHSPTHYPEEVLKIGAGAFYNTPNLHSVVFGSNSFTFDKSSTKGNIGDPFSADNLREDIMFYKPESYYTNEDLNPYTVRNIGKLTCNDVTYTGKPAELTFNFESYIDGVTLQNNLSGDAISYYGSETNAGYNYSGIAIVSIYNSSPYWNFSYLNDYNYTIKEAPLNITVVDKTREYGEENPDFDIEISGYVNGEDESIFTDIPCIGNGLTENDPEMPTAKSPVGEYIIITHSTLSHPKNYTIQGGYGKLTITPAALEISCSNYTKEYGEANPTVELSYNGFKNEETASDLTAQPTVEINADEDSEVGEYQITIAGAESANYNISYNTATLTVIPASQTITWEQDLSEVNIGDEIVLTATASSGFEVTYTSTDNDIAEVINGKLIVKKSGVVIITAEQSGDKNHNAAESVSKTVYANAALISSITLDTDNINMKVDDSYQLEAIILPENATNKILVWQSSNENVATIDNTGLVTAVSSGTANIQASSTDGSGVIANCQIVVTTATGVSQIATAEGYQISTINGNIVINGLDYNQVVHIVGIDGRTVYYGTERNIALNHGVYIVKIGAKATKVRL